MASNSLHPPPSSRPPPLAPPPPPPPSPWRNRPFQPGQAIMKDIDGWPHRLLHVATMTSHVKQGKCTYNGVKAPAYNVISYTWGFYQDKTGQQPSLTIHGVDWPIPSIQARHFTPETFSDAIRTVADGVNHSCEWIWLDVACIPQYHDKETRESVELRVQEIGRQAKIFQKACEAFVWLSSLRKTDFIGNRKRLVDSLDITELVFEGPKTDPIKYLEKLQDYVHSYCSSFNRLLDHPWFISLWTLQENKLRPDASIIFDDGHMRPLKDDGSRLKWGLGDVYHITDEQLLFLAREYDKSVSATLRRRVSLARSMVPSSALEKIQDPSDELLRHLNRLFQRLVVCGFNGIPAEFPNVVYSLAQYRRSTLPEDRIYGIMQTYNISCDQVHDIPTGASRLQALEDDFGAKLIKQLPIVSQLFVHTIENGRPRRSWLITNECYAADPHWHDFISQKQVESLFAIFEVVNKKTAQNLGQDLFLHFKGVAWNLDCMIQVLKEPTKGGSQKLRFLTSSSPDRSSNQGQYRGLLLDHHVSRALFGRSFSYFQDLGTLLDACRKLSELYCHGAANSNPSGPKRHIQVALLGSSWRGSLPIVEYVGVVLAPVSIEFTGMQGSEEVGDGIADATVWERVGLLRWSEHYRELHPVWHQDFPASHEFTCLIR